MNQFAVLICVVPDDSLELMASTKMLSNWTLMQYAIDARFSTYHMWPWKFNESSNVAWQAIAVAAAWLIYIDV